MNQAASLLLNYNDFGCFSKTRTQVKTNICDVKYAVWTKTEEQLAFEITADRFLRNMVRAIVGTLVAVGKKEITAAEVREIVESKNRSNAGESFPACGLYLTKIIYPKEIFLNE